MYKTAAEVVALLAVPYSGPTKEKDGFTYIPAQESRRTLDAIFGPLGWHEEPVLGSANPREGVYTAAVKITGFVRDDETGEVRAISRAGYGRSTAQATRKERDEEGLTVTRNLQIHDTAAAGAGTDAFSRACKKFGPALGSDLYDDHGGQSGGSAPSAPRRQAASGGNNGDLGFRPSEKQMAKLGANGYTDEQVAGMPFRDWKQTLDDLFSGNTPAIAPARAPRTARRPAPVAVAAPDDSDDIPF